MTQTNRFWFSFKNWFKEKEKVLVNDKPAIIYHGDKVQEKILIERDVELQPFHTVIFGTIGLSSIASIIVVIVLSL